MAEAMRKIIEAHVPLDVLLAYFTDTLAFLTLRLTGDEGLLRFTIRRLEGRIEEEGGHLPRLTCHRPTTIER